MADDFYVTLFSNSSQDLYPNNVMSRFTCKLPRPIKLEGNYRVGLIEIQYPAFQGIVTGGNDRSDESEDQIIFPSPTKSEKDKILTLKGFANEIIVQAKQPNIYMYDRYFTDFTNYNKLNNFDKNYSKYKAKSTANEKKNDIYKVAPSVVQYRASTKEKNIHIVCKKRYKLKELMYEYLKYHYDQYKEYTNAELQTQYNILGYDDYVVGALLSKNAQDLHYEIKNIMLQTLHDAGFYIAVHTDIIEPRIVGNSISRVLYFGSKKTNYDLDEIFIQNVQYVPVTKNYIEEISFIITNENGERILFESGYKPISLTLKFKKV